MAGTIFFCLRDLVSKQRPLVTTFRSLAIYLIVTCAASHVWCQSEYEKTIQAGLEAVYSRDYSKSEAAFKKLHLLRGDFPADLVYRELQDSWMAADDPENQVLVQQFERDAQAAISACRAWTASYPNDAEGWRYLASAYGQQSQFDFTVKTGFWAMFSSMRLGLKMHDAAMKASSLDGSDPDIKLGLGSYDYFAAKPPLLVRVFARMFTIPGDRDRGIEQIKNTIANGRHMRIEAAMVLASAYWSEGNYDAFNHVVETDILSRYPRLLVVRTWQISGLICSNRVDEARKLAQSIEADTFWKDFQLARIELAAGSQANGEDRTNDLQSARQYFVKSISESGSNGSILRWDYVGVTRAEHAIGAPTTKVPSQFSNPNPELAERLFRSPGGCPH